MPILLRSLTKFRVEGIPFVVYSSNVTANAVIDGVPHVCKPGRAVDLIAALVSVLPAASRSS